MSNIWQVRGNAQIQVNGISHRLNKPNGAIWNVFRNITNKRAGNYLLRGEIRYGVSTIQDSEIVLEVIGTHQSDTEHEVYYKRIELSGRADNFFEFSIPDIDIHYGLTYRLELTLSGQAMDISLQNINLTRTNRKFGHAIGDIGLLSKVSRRDTSLRLGNSELLEFEGGVGRNLSGLLPEIKDGLYFYPQSREWFGDRNLNHQLPNAGYSHPELRVFSSEKIGQPRKDEFVHIFSQARPNDVCEFRIKNENRPIFIRAGIVNNNGNIDPVNGYWNLEITNNGTREITVRIRQTSNLINRRGEGRQTIFLPINVFRDFELNRSIGRAEINLEYNYLT